MTVFTRHPARCSIHRQIMTIALAPALIITSLLVFVVYQGNLQYHRWLLDQQGQLLATQLAGALEYGLATGAREQLPAIVDSTIKPATAILGTPVRAVTVTDEVSRVLYRRLDPPAEQPSGGDAAGGIVVPADDTSRFAVPIVLQPLTLTAGTVPAPRPLGQVTVELSVAVAQAHWQRRLARDLGLVLLIFAGAVSLAHGTGRRLSGAIGRIAAAIQRIKDGDLTTRLPHTDLNELGTLQEGVNLLADTLARGKARLDQELAKVRGEYQQALEALQVQTQAAEQANQAKSLFLAKVSHEMRTPLYSIQGLLEQLLKIDRDEAEVRTLRIIQDAAHTLYRHISDILDLTQWEKGNTALPLAPVVVWTELEAVVTPLEPLLTRRELYLDVIVAPTVPAALESNSKALRSILANLLSNAVKFTPTGGIVVWLEVVPQATGRHHSEPQALLRVRVADTGCGIPSDRLEAIFSPFTQVDEALNRRLGGTGLGLSIVKTQCERLGGHITVASTLEQGSTFTVELPCRPVARGANRCYSAAPAIPEGWRVLVADERASFRASIVTRLASLGLTVEEQAFPLTAWATAPAPATPYDLLIVQNLAVLPPDTMTHVIAGLRRWATRLVALETGYDAEVAQRNQSAGVSLTLWSGASRAQWQAVLGRVCEETAPSAAVALAPSAQTPAPLDGLTVLVVEDHAINRLIMVNQLHGNGARVLEAGDGDTAVALAAESGIDLILMDIQMPGKDGIAAIQDIRRLPSGDQVPIVGFTASADKPTHQRILRAGADRVLTKPISEAELIRAIQRALQQAMGDSWRLRP